MIFAPFQGPGGGPNKNCAVACPIHVSNSHTKFGWISSNGLGGDCMTDGWTGTLTGTLGFVLGTYSVRKSCQESVSTQQIPGNFYVINLILSLLASFVCK